MSLTKLSKIEESIALYLSAADKFNDLVHRKQPASPQSVRDVACHAMMVFYAYNLPCNRTSDGQPRIAIPSPLAQDVARNIQLILEGHIPRWMLHLVKPGAPSAHPRMRQEIGLAVAYKKLCDAGLISDRHSTKTISDMYGVTTRRVQHWMKEYGYSEPSLWFPDAAGEAERARLIQEALPNFAASYKQWGRAPGNARPYGKARRRPTAKR
jgi:hypothetical protein